MARSLVIDYKINKIIQGIQAQYREKGQELSYGTIVRVVESQLNAIVDGMAKGDSIVLKYLGTFAATSSRVDRLNKQYKKKGKDPGLVDTGFLSMSFKKDGTVNGSTELAPNRKDNGIQKG